MRQPAERWIGLIGSCLCLGVVTALFTVFWPSWRHVSLTVHSAVEAFGAALILLAAMLLLLLAEDRPQGAYRRWASAALMATGFLDACHAAAPPGQGFVALRTFATFYGGLIICGLWLPLQWQRSRAASGLIRALLFGSVASAITMLLMPAVVPVMVLPDGHFSPLTTTLNLIGGMGYLVAMVYFGRSDAAEDRLLAGLCLLMGVSGMVLPLSSIWSAAWWGWHGFRLVGAMFAASFFFYVYRNLGRETREALRSRETFISMASHELRTPLMPLLLRLQMIQRDMQAGRSVTPQAIDKAVRNVQQVTSLVNSLLATLEVGSDRLSLQCEPLSLTAIVREMAETYRLVSAKHQILIDEPLAEVQVHGDSLRLSQVVANLLDNAITYSPGGAVTVALRVQGGMAAVRVSDQGIGIPAGDMHAIFDRFYRGGNFSPLQIPGLGLGLYISRGIVEQHGGRIDITSPDGQGTVVTVLLPRLDSTTADSPSTPGVQAA